MISPGTYTLGPPQGRLLLRVYREGLAKKVGHDLVLEATGWSATVTVADDPVRSSLEATADAGSLEVAEGTGGAKPLTEGDKADIKKTIDEKVLRTRQYPQIAFRSTAVEARGPGRARVTGNLTIAGTTRPATLDLSLQGGRARATTTVVQSEFGIKPFTAFLGALKVRDPVEIEVEAALPAS